MAHSIHKPQRQLRIVLIPQKIMFRVESVCCKTSLYTIYATDHHLHKGRTYSLLSTTHHISGDLHNGVGDAIQTDTASLTDALGKCLYHTANQRLVYKCRYVHFTTFAKIIIQSHKHLQSRSTQTALN